MSFDPNFNSGQPDNYMSTENFLDFEGLADNEDSIDISSLIQTGACNLDSEEDLFKSLFPAFDSPDFKKEESESSSVNEFEQPFTPPYHQYLPSGPASSCVSACSSAAPSPVPFNRTPYNYQPPVTPSGGERSLLLQRLQIDGTRLPNMSTPGPQYSPVMQESADIGRQQQSRTVYEAQGNVSLNLTQLTSQQPQHKTEPGLMNASVKTEIVDKYPPIKQEEGTMDMDMPLALTTDRAKQPLTSNLNMSNKRSHSTDQRGAKKAKTIAKGTPEYQQKRERNNVAVRRSRDKAKRKALETQEKVQSLSHENKQLKEEVKNLKSEVNTLKSLLQNLSGYPNLKSSG